VYVLYRRFDDHHGHHHHHHHHHHRGLMCGSVLRVRLYRPRPWTGGRGWSSTCTCPCFAIGELLGSWSILMMGRHVWLRLNPSSLLKLSGCSRISIASLTRRSIYLVAVLSVEVPSKSMQWYVVNECFATADLSG
jgi:hypothetical protein